MKFGRAKRQHGGVLGRVMPVAENRWVILLVLFVARTAMALQFQTVASSGPLLIEALAIDYASLGLLIGLYMMPGVVIALPGGVLGQHFGAKRIVLVGLALMAIGGALMGMTSAFPVAAMGRLIAGVGAVLFNVLVTKMVADWFAGREIVTAMSVLVSSWPLGLALGLVCYGSLAAAYGWPALMHAGALSALIALILVALIYRDPPQMSDTGSARLRLDLTRREWLLVCIAGAIWGIFNVAYIVLISFAPQLFAARGYAPSDAAWIVSLLGWVLIASIPFSGYLVERWGRPNLFMAGSFAIVGVLTAALPFLAAPLLAFSMLSVVVGVPAGLIMALPAQALRPQSRAAGMGVFYTCYYVAMAMLPGGAGLARDLTGSPAAPVLFAATMMLLCLPGLASFHVAKRQSG